jgi:hypothetical protein
MPVPILSMNYTMNRTSSQMNNKLLNKSSTPMMMPFNLKNKSTNNNLKTVVGLEIKPSKAYKGCGSCGRG